jgi:hypothetical protein
MIHPDPITGASLKPEAEGFYRQALVTLKESDIPFLLGGAYALCCHTGIVRHTKDLDVFTRPADCRRVLDLFAGLGYRTELTDPLWLGKVFSDDHYVDIIFGSGRGVAQVDDGWFAHARGANVMGLDVRLCPPEETLWSKSFVMERERYDGADVAHLILCCGEGMNWPRLLRRFGPQWPVLYTYLVQFHFLYPGERHRVPAWVMDELAARLAEEHRRPPPAGRVCNGAFLSGAQFRVDLEQWGYTDGRLLAPNCSLEPQS